MAKYPCGYCKKDCGSLAGVRLHGPSCPELKRRLDELPSFIAAKVHKGGLKLEAAEREYAAWLKDNPPLRL